MQHRIIFLCILSSTQFITAVADCGIFRNCGYT